MYNMQEQRKDKGRNPLRDGDKSSCCWGAASFGQLLAALSGRHKSGNIARDGAGEVRITGNNATANKES